ncbi:MAG: hypothetical protein ACOYYS_10790 [Chloroflexota bacterium]
MSQPICPVGNSDIRPDFDFPGYFETNDIQEQLLAYLNDGGSLELAQAAFESEFKAIEMADVTGDGVNELVGLMPQLWVAACRDGEYIELYSDPEAPDLEGIVAIRDINQDGVVEIAFYGALLYSWATYYRIFAWDGDDFRDLIQQGEDTPAWLAFADAQGLFWYEGGYIGESAVGGSFTSGVLQDLDGDGTEEFVADIGVRQKHDILRNGPWRRVQETYQWDGEHYMFVGLTIDPPEYRFQAVQDGDRMVYIGKYEEALALYQTAIFSDQVIAWSPEHYLAQVDGFTYGTTTPTPIAYDSEEYNHLAAYAYFRILSLHIAQGYVSDAQVVYDTLQQKFPAGQSGGIYTETAIGFWEKYQATHDIVQACEVAIEHAETNLEEFFYYLGDVQGGDDYRFGYQGHEYVPSDVCPFKE